MKNKLERGGLGTFLGKSPEFFHTWVDWAAARGGWVHADLNLRPADSLPVYWNSRTEILLMELHFLGQGANANKDRPA